jgi:hypothetical protein
MILFRHADPRFPFLWESAHDAGLRLADCDAEVRRRYVRPPPR